MLHHVLRRKATAVETLLVCAMATAATAVSNKVCAGITVHNTLLMIVERTCLQVLPVKVSNGFFSLLTKTQNV